MAAIFISPFSIPSFPGGVAGGASRADSTTRSQTGLGVPVGTKAYDVAGNEYTAVKAGAAINVNEPVRLNAGLSDVRATSAAQQNVIGVADAAFASGDFGWILSRGSVTCKVVGATAINSLLVTGAVAATLELADATDFAGARSIAQLSAEAGGLATIYLS